MARLRPLTLPPMRSGNPVASDEREHEGAEPSRADVEAHAVWRRIRSARLQREVGTPADPRRVLTEPDLSFDTIAVLLAGWGAKPPSGWPTRPGFGGGFLSLGITGGPGPGGVWAAHADFLRNMAARWQWSPSCLGPDGVTRFFGEHCVLFAEHEAVYPDTGEENDDDRE